MTRTLTARADRRALEYRGAGKVRAKLVRGQTGTEQEYVAAGVVQDRWCLAIPSSAGHGNGSPH